jgi:cobalamin biosynthetic protein CobC
MNNRLSTAPAHGGDLSEASDRFGRSEEEWLDLSTGINPHPYPNTAVSPNSLSRLPSSGALNGLLTSARAAYGIPHDAGLCAAPGTQAILQVLPEIIGSADIAVVSPTYG